MIGLTRLAYPSLKSQSRWVVVIGLELLSFARIGLGLDRVMYRYFMLSPVGYLRVVIILEIRIWGDRNGNCVWL
jgi:hypothetical protein